MRVLSAQTAQAGDEEYEPEEQVLIVCSSGIAERMMLFTPGIVHFPSFFGQDDFIWITFRDLGRLHVCQHYFFSLQIVQRVFQDLGLGNQLV